MNMDDQDLRTRIRDGDTAAFAELYDSCAKAVYNHAFRLTGDWAAAEDVMSQAFLEAWRNRAKIAPDGGSLRPWLLGVATNIMRGQHRSARKRRDLLRRLPDADYLPDFADDVAGRLDDARRIAELREALSGLRRDELDVLSLCAWSGLSYAEAAEALRVPVGTVRSRLSRARAKLTRNQGKKGEPDPVRRPVRDGIALASPSIKETSR
jgi:RNA polymerase sigma-70 factor (ECF subfamily)